MFDTRKTLHDRGILDVIKILSTNGESGRLEIVSGTTEGAFFFKEGQLVAARLGHLTGFQAINALASIRGARFHFDPSVAPPSVSSITPSERVVLKQFFGIDTFNPDEASDSPADEDVTIETARLAVPVVTDQVVPDHIVADQIVPDQVVPEPVLNPRFSKSFFYRSGLVLALLFVLIAVTAVALRNRYRERALTPAVAQTAPSVTQTAPADPPSVTEEVKKTEPSTSTSPTIASSTSPVMDEQDLTGRWRVVNTVQKTAYRSFRDLKIGFDLAISQNGKSFTGKGVKVSENGRSLPAGSRTPIQVEGSINGDRIEATFFEAGSLRKTTGRFVWRIDKTGGLNGTFASTAAGSSGKSAARKS